MRQITSITSLSKQKFDFVTLDGTKVVVYLYFLPTQESWFVDVSTDKFSINCLKVCASLNILDKFHNIIDFGIRIDTEDGLDPWRIDDFENGYAEFLILSKEELEQTTEFLSA